MILVKLYTIILLVLPYILFLVLNQRSFGFQSLRPIISITDVRVHKIFLDSFILQLLNPILLPSLILARLVNMFFFS
jgi:hypothetical protein